MTLDLLTRALTDADDDSGQALALATLTEALTHPCPRHDKPAGSPCWDVAGHLGVCAIRARKARR